MRKFITLLMCFALSIAIVAGTRQADHDLTLTSSTTYASGWFSQHVTGVSAQVSEINVLYDNGTVIGYVHDKEKLKRHLHRVYHEKYESDFPGSSLDLADGLKLEKEYTLYQWNNEDDAIIRWLDRHQAYSLAATEIAFSNDSGVYDRIYVNDVSVYENALRSYLSFFVGEEYLDSLLDGKTVAMPSDYGSADIGLAMQETVTVRSARALPQDIYTNEKDVLLYLEYGGNAERSYYVVQDGDTLAGIGEKNGGLSPQQIVNINADMLKSTDDVLVPGERLCITYFESPVTIQVYRASLVREDIPFQTDYVRNFMTNSTRTVMQEGKDGLRTAMYRETWINGVLSSSEEISSVESRKATDQVKTISNDEERGTGTGSWQIPVDHAKVSCTWGCYLNYDAVSFQNAYDLWGNVYAADNGVVTDQGYDEENGNWIKISHQNGYSSVYALMQEPSSLTIGTVLQKGDVIGQIGSSGNSTYPHLKFWIEDDQGNHINPLSLENFPACPNES